MEEKVYRQIVELCESGNMLVNDGKYEGAINNYINALNLIPEPKFNWEASTWVYTALGDTYYISNDFQEALNYFFETLKCPNGIGNPFILFRIGECFYELGNTERAKEYLLQAYMLEGIDVFSEEDEKYYQLIKDIV